jgi:putative Holliday junction resolvase
MDTLLGFDYGLRRIGVAVGQTLTQSATPLVTLQITNDEPDWASIDELIKSWKPAALVVGLPLNMDGTEHALTHASNRFAKQLYKRYSLQVHRMDERLTSVEAEERLVTERRSGGRKIRKGDLDRVAAQIILQSWLLQGNGD